MKVIIDVNHPKNVHIFKNFAWKMLDNGHDVFFTALEKDLTVELLNAYKLPYKILGKTKSGIIKKSINIFFYCFKLNCVFQNYKPDICISQGSIFLSIMAFLWRKPHVGVHDTEHASYNHFISHSLENILITSVSYKKNLGHKQIRFNGYLEHAYLHPNVFKNDFDKVPVPDIGINIDDDFIIVRFVAWDSSHDIGHTGISLKNKILAVKSFSKYGKVYVSSENDLPKELKKYEYKMPPILMHSLMAKAKLFYGESATMAAESALLGVPAIYLDNDGRGYTDDLEKRYGLVYNFSESETDQVKSIDKGVELLANKNMSRNIKEKYKNFLKNKDDLTDFLVKFIENYSDSSKN